MTAKKVKNIPASVRQRLLNKAKADERSFNELLQYYATRVTNIPVTIDAFSDEFGWVKQAQWLAFRKRIKQENTPKEFIVIIDVTKSFLVPIIRSIQNNTNPPDEWIAPGPWK